MSPRAENRFTQYVRTLGRGKSSTRHLTFDEAMDAMGQVLDDQVEPEQLGAFLMLLRVKEESAEEIAGFCAAARKRLPVTAPEKPVDLDWSCYAGKKRQPPWLVLSQRLLSEMGYRQIVHGTRGHTPGRLYVQDTYEALGLTVITDPEKAAAHRVDELAYVSLDALSPALERIIQLRPLMGLRSPVHSFARLLNPYNATTVLQGIFHTGYREVHQQAGQMLGYRNVMVIRGEGGEFEVKPNARIELDWVHNGQCGSGVMARSLQQRPEPYETLYPETLQRIWTGDLEDEPGRLAIIGTAALALMAHEHLEQDTAVSRVAAAWENRERHW